jgi:hypothetical protein
MLHSIKKHIVPNDRHASPNLLLSMDIHVDLSIAPNNLYTMQTTGKLLRWALAEE